VLGKFAAMGRATLLAGENPAHLMEWLQEDGCPLALVIDHDLGGGANLYRSRLVARLAAEGHAVVLLQAHRGVRAYQLSGIKGGHTRTAYVRELNTLFDVLSHADFRQAVFNNILSFPEPLALVAALTEWLKMRKAEQFLFLVHDHYCICPAWLLLNDGGEYCGIPEASVCAACLPNNKAPFLSYARGADVAGWRAAWKKLLQQAAEIRCFSNASRSLMLRGYPGIDPAIVTVVPHALEHVRLWPVALHDPGCPVIGVIGHIDGHKGARQVRELAEYIQRSGKKARLAVIGTIHEKLPSGFVTVTGRYRVEELPMLVEKYSVNVGFFPSICPETFSYVTEEMMQMELPILAFDLGAQGERVSSYGRGRVMPVESAERIWEQIEALYRTHVASAKRPS
jgi:glycosyltransferase involved in cell wall biosynthesis